MKTYPIIALLLTALTAPAAALAQQGASSSTKPKEIVVVGPKTADADAPIVMGRVYNDPTRAVLLEPTELEALATGNVRGATMEVPDGPLAEVLREAFGTGEPLEELSLGAVQADDRAGYHTIKLEKVRVTSISPGDTYGRVKVQFHWDRAGDAAGTPLIGMAIGNLADKDDKDAAAKPAAPGQGWYRTRPFVSLVVGGVEIAQFSELAGINSSVEPVTIVLKRGEATGPQLQAWHEAVRMGNLAAARKNASLVMYDYAGKPVARYHLENAWPSKIEIGALKAGASEVPMETVTIVSESLQRVAP